jgi:hypothetical protein
MKAPANCVSCGLEQSRGRLLNHGRAMILSWSSGSEGRTRFPAGLPRLSPTIGNSRPKAFRKRFCFSELMTANSGIGSRTPSETLPILRPSGRAGMPRAGRTAHRSTPEFVCERGATLVRSRRGTGDRRTPGGHRRHCLCFSRGSQNRPDSDDLVRPRAVPGALSLPIDSQACSVCAV